MCVTNHRLTLRVVLFLAVLVFGVSPQTKAQDRSVPRSDYFLSFRFFNDGNYRSAMRAFRAAARSGIRSSEGRWVDSICYHTMIGECYYHMGDLANALDQYDAALKLFVRYNNWLLRINFPPALTASNRVVTPRITWGVPKRQFALARIPDTMSSLQGAVNNLPAVVRGGVVAPPQLFPLRVAEIVRCTTLSIRRRTEIMGPTSPHSALTKQLLEVLSTRPAPPNHWSQAWIDTQLGLAYASAGKTTEATRELQRSLVSAGQFNHTLSGTALIELGKIAFHKNQFDQAANYFYEATFPAAAMNQHHLVAEAFRWGLQTHIVSGRDGIYPPLNAAVAWARRTSRQLEVSLLQSTAENFAHLGNATAAQAAIDQAQRSIRRSDLNGGEIGARLRFTQAQIQYQVGNRNGADKNVGSVLSYQQKASPWLFQIGLSDKLYAAGAVSERIADQLFEQLLREPTAADWTLSPRETLAYISTPHFLPMEHWFEISIKRKEPEKALDVADRLRRHRFFSSLPLGGRLTALRWVLEAPEAALSDAAKLQRQDLLNKFPGYKALREQSQQIRDKLRQLPLAGGTEDETKQTEQLSRQLELTSDKQELILREIAIRREPSDFAFPPLRSIKDIKKQLPDNTYALAYFTTSRYAYAFAFNKDQYAHWQLGSSKRLQVEIGKLLKQMGHMDRHVEIDEDQLKDDAWKETSRELLKKLTNNAAADIWDRCDNLVIVPDGPLWYVPFGALHVGNDPLISKVQIRHAPTVSTILRDGLPSRPNARSAVSVTRMFVSDDDTVGQKGFDQIAAAMPDVTKLPVPLPTTTATAATVIDRLVVLGNSDDMYIRSPYAWAPLPQGRKRARSSLDDWMRLPFGAPEQVVMPAYHTAAESALKRGGTGSEIFLAVCGLMASGSRTIALSRWQTGGQSSYDLVKELTQELPNRSATSALHRAIQVVMKNPLDPSSEPRIKTLKAANAPKTDHPFFWSGFLIIDSAQRK